MTTSSDVQREVTMKALIEAALKQAAAGPGAPSFAIEGWTQGDAEPELSVLVGGRPRVLEVSQPFLEDEPDEDARRKIAAAAAHLIRGEARRVQLFHRGVFVAWEIERR